MKKLLCFILMVSLVLPLLYATPAVAATPTYGADNLNNLPGELVIGFIGGSITEGSGASPAQNRWSTKTVENYFKKAYPNKTVKELNAAIGGTGSSYGHVRIAKDLMLNAANTPDVVFIEFAVNDAGGGGMAITQNMESMVRQLLALPKIPVIIFVYTTSQKSLNMIGTQDNCVENSIAASHIVAQRYGIYEIDLNAHIWDGVKKGQFVWDKDKTGTLTGDNTHPNNAGYQVYADKVVSSLQADAKKVFVKHDPNTLPCGTYVHGVIEEIPLSNPAVKLSSGWTKINYTPISIIDNPLKMSDYFRRFFTEGYYQCIEGVGQTITYEFTGRGVGIDYVRTKNNASFDWKVYSESGVLEKSGTTAMYYLTDTNRCEGRILATDLPYGKHKLVLTGILNQTAINDYNSSGGTKGGTGKELNVGYIVVEKSMPVIAPHAKNVSYTGTGIVGTELNGSYVYEGSMYAEKNSVSGWYMSSTVDGTYTLVSSGNKYTIAPSDKDKFFKFGVTPINAQGTSGQTVYTDPVQASRAPGTIKFSQEFSIKLNGVPSTTAGAGENNFSTKIANDDVNPCSVTVYAATYKVTNGIKTMTGIKKQTKTIPAGGSADFSVTLTALATDSEIRCYAFCDDSLEPVIKAEDTPAFEYVGTEDEVTIYKINRFE